MLVIQMLANEMLVFLWLNTLSSSTRLDRIDRIDRNRIKRKIGRKEEKKEK